MNLLSKLRVAQVRGHVPVPSRDLRAPLPVRAASASPEPTSAPRRGRSSNGLKEFLWQLNGIGHGQLLDLGPVWQATVSFFIERGFKIYAEDLLGSWRDFLNEEAESSRHLVSDNEAPDRSPAAVAERFLSSNLHHASDSFDAVFLWDLLDYLDSETTSCVVARLTTLVRDGGVVLAMFHTRMPEVFYRYRLLDALNLELVAAPALVPPKHIYQNREMQDLFGRFRSSKTFVGRDQLREVVFVK